jgi:membrane-associated protease RseP (regulator of RpoE activity)
MNETKNWKVATFVLVGLLLMILACCVGAWFGGLVGYSVGKRSSHEMHEYEMPHAPIPPMPEQPEMPVIPFPEHPEIPMPREEERAYLGVAFRMVEDGALVALVVPESAAEAAGLREGDIITEVDGRPVNETRPLNEHIGRYEPGDRIELTILRDGRKRDISVRLGVQPAEPPVSPMRHEDGL